MGRWRWREGESREGDPILAAFESDEGGVRDSAVGVKGLEIGKGDGTCGLVLGVDVVVAGSCAHEEQGWRGGVDLASLEEEIEARWSWALR